MLKDVAMKFFKLGFNVVPFLSKEKSPLVEWKRWQNQRQTQTEFEALPWNNADGFGVVCGRPNEQGLSICVIDFDVKKTSLEAQETGVKVLSLLRVTAREKTPSGGEHLIYFSRKPAKTISAYHDSVAVELLGQNKLCLMYPSEGYSKLNDNLPSIVEDAEVEFLNALKRVGVIKPASKQKQKVQVRPCFEKLMQKTELTHDERVALVNELEHNGYSKMQIMEIFHENKAWEVEYNPEKTDKQIDSVYGKYGHFTKFKLRQKGVCFSGCGLESHKDCRKAGAEKKEEEKLVVFKPFTELEDGRLLEQAFDGNEVFFLVYDPQTEEVTKTYEVEMENFTLKPIDNDEVRQGTVLLPSNAEEYESEEKLTMEIRDYLNRWHEAPDHLSRTLDVYYCYLTYIYDLTPQLPYRRYLAPWGRGKSAWLETLGWICYRGILLAGSDTDKSVVRKMNNWRGTALIDEADFGNSTLYAFLIKILNIGYDKKTGYYHRSDDNDPNKILSYAVYCPKLLATREKYDDLALESRCLTTIGRQNTGPVPLFRMDKFLVESQKLRNKLTLWRFRNYGKIKQAAKELEDKGVAAKVYDGADSVSSRVKQVILPLWLIGGDSMKQTLTDMAKTFDNILKIEDPDYLLQLQARDAVEKIVKDVEEEEQESGEHRNEENILIEEATKEIFYVFPLNLISRTVLIGRGAKKEEITVSDVTSTSKSLKSIFESVLGFHIRIGKKKRREVLIPSSWLKEKPEEPEEEKGLEKFFEEGGLQ
jgi:hypothetical protein